MVTIEGELTVLKHAVGHMAAFSSFGNTSRYPEEEGTKERSK